MTASFIYCTCHQGPYWIWSSVCGARLEVGLGRTPSSMHQPVHARTTDPSCSVFFCAAALMIISLDNHKRWRWGRREPDWLTNDGELPEDSVELRHYMEPMEKKSSLNRHSETVGLICDQLDSVRRASKIIQRQACYDSLERFVDGWEGRAGVSEEP